MNHTTSRRSYTPPRLLCRLVGKGGRRAAKENKVSCAKIVERLLRVRAKAGLLENSKWSTAGGTVVSPKYQDPGPP